MKKVLLGTLAALLLMGPLACSKHDDDRYRSRKYEKKWKKKHKKNWKKKHKKNWKAEAPSISAEEAKQSPKGIGKLLFRAALKGDEMLAEKVVLKDDEGKAFAKGALFLDKGYANAKKRAEKFKAWKEAFKKAKYKRIKLKDDEKLEVKPSGNHEKYKELSAALTKSVTIWQGKAIGKLKDGRKAKCAYVAIKLGEKSWRLLRLKGCKKKLDGEK